VGNLDETKLPGLGGAGWVKESGPIGSEPVSAATRVVLKVAGFLHAAESTLVLSDEAEAAATVLRTLGFLAEGLPRLSSSASFAQVPTDTCANLLCLETIDRVGREDLITYALELARVTTVGGRLVLAYHLEDRHPPPADVKDGLPVGKLILLMESAGFRTLQSSQEHVSGTLARYVTILMEKADSAARGGLETVQSILAQDAKFATYKYALIRALAVISRNEPSIACWRQARVYIPLFSIAVRWLAFYWPLLTHETFIAQNRSGEKKRKLAFRGQIEDLCRDYSVAGIYDLLRDIDQNPTRFGPTLRTLADTIRKGPVTFSGTGTSPVFAYAPSVEGEGPGMLGFGWVVMPESLWVSITRFEHWIEDSLIVRWSQLTAEMNRTEDTGFYLNLLLRTPEAKRDTLIIRRLLGAAAQKAECVWSGRALDGMFDVDHAIPYSVWRNNDLWNLLPCDTKLNGQKRDHLPTSQLLLQRRDRIIEYWQTYEKEAPDLFRPQVRRALGSTVSVDNWETRAFAGLIENVERLAVARGIPRWSP